ncbi:hypothetical protein BsWGS_18196 [Bradybaena similaris]
MPCPNRVVKLMLLVAAGMLFTTVNSVHDMCQIEECEEPACFQPNPCDYYNCVSCFCTPVCINTGKLGK